MRRTRWIAVAVVAMLAGALMAPVAVAQEDGGSGGAAPTQEIGITEDTITVTVVAAIEVPGFPGLFQGMHNGVDAWADYVNDNGGLAGRQIEVNHVDPKLSGDEARNGFIDACSDSFALIGTGVLLLRNFDDLTNCADSTGAVTGLPDFAVVVTEPPHQCSPTTFGINPAALDCSTIDQHPQTYRVNIGPTSYYVKKFGDLKGAFLLPSDSASAANSQIPIFRAQADAGIENVFEQKLSALAPQSEYTSVAGQIRDAGATYARSGLAFDSTVKMRKEAATQGVNSVKVWDCSLQCYDPKLVAPENVDAVEDQYVYTQFLPFLGKNGEKKQNKMLRTFLKYADNPDGFAIQAFAAGLFFQEAVEAVVAKNGEDGLTRAALLEEAANVHDFDAGGMIGQTDVGGRVPSSCFVLTQVKSGEFVRLLPKKKGTFNCAKKNRKTIELDLET